jgi:hypothetical protein
MSSSIAVQTPYWSRGRDSSSFLRSLIPSGYAEEHSPSSNLFFYHIFEIRVVGHNRNTASTEILQRVLWAILLLSL